MNKGKVTCEKLKAIRREVAEKLGIEYSPKECTFEGDCLGTCPLCQQETDMLMEQVRIRLEERPELLDEIQCKVSEMYQIDADKEDDDTIILEGMPAEPLQGLVDVDDESLEGDPRALEGNYALPDENEVDILMGDIPVMGGIPFEKPDYSKIAPFCKYYDPNAISMYYHEETEQDCFSKAEERIYHANELWDIVFEADDPQLAFQELFVRCLSVLYPNKLSHLLQVFFADHPTYKKQLMAIVMSIKKGHR